MKPTGFHCGSIRQWCKNGVEKNGFTGKKATTTQVKMNDNRHDWLWSCLLFFVIKIFELVTIYGKLLISPFGFFRRVPEHISIKHIT